MTVLKIKKMRVCVFVYDIKHMRERVCLCTRERESSTWRCREGYGAGGRERVVRGVWEGICRRGGGSSSIWGCREGHGSTNLEIALPIHAFGQALRVRQVAVGVEDGEEVHRHVTT